MTEAAPAAATWPGSRTEAVPPDITQMFGALTGLDLSGTRVHRGPSVSGLAHTLQARAFTRSGEIFLPDEAGPIDQGESRALVAHELIHVAQQRVLAPSLPGEDSREGRELEDEAVAAERWFRPGGTPPPRLAHLPVASVLARYARASPASHAPRTAASSRPDVQRREVRAQAAPPVNTAPPVNAPPVNTRPTASVVATSINGSASPAPARAETTQPVSTATRPRDDRRPADLDDPTSLDELTRKIYPRLRRLLRGELLADRERAGLLGDFS